MILRGVAPSASAAPVAIRASRRVVVARGGGVATASRPRRRSSSSKSSKARSIHWFPYGRVGVVNADP
eukprot:30720-Pelagococcus_subviridis.AAC.4